MSWRTLLANIKLSRIRQRIWWYDHWKKLYLAKIILNIKVENSPFNFWLIFFLFNRHQMFRDQGSHLLLQFDHTFRLSGDKFVIRNDKKFNSSHPHKCAKPISLFKFLRNKHANTERLFIMAVIIRSNWGSQIPFANDKLKVSTHQHHFAGHV